MSSNSQSRLLVEEEWYQDYDVISQPLSSAGRPYHTTNTLLDTQTYPVNDTCYTTLSTPVRVTFCNLQSTPSVKHFSNNNQLLPTANKSKTVKFTLAPSAFTPSNTMSIRQDRSRRIVVAIPLCDEEICTSYREEGHNTNHRGDFEILEVKDEASLEEIQGELDGIVTSMKHLSDKLTDLKTCYRGEKGTSEPENGPRVSSDDVKQSNGIPFDSLQYSILPSIIPGKPISNTSNDATMMDRSPWLDVRSDFAKQPVNKYREIPPTTRSVQSVIYSAASTLEDVTSEPHVEEKDDEIFGEFVTNMLSSIPECEEKDDLKQHIQRRLLITKSKILRKSIPSRIGLLPK